MESMSLVRIGIDKNSNDTQSYSDDGTPLGLLYNNDAFLYKYDKKQSFIILGILKLYNE